MENIEKIKKEIISKLKDLNPKKVILFGSYASKNFNDNSDIDIFILKNLPDNKLAEFELMARKKLREVIFKYKISIDIISASEKILKEKKDHFIIKDIITKGETLYSE